MDGDGDNDSGGARDPHDEIVRLEARIDALADRIESCRKIILASRIAAAGGAVVLAAMLFGIIRFDPLVMAGAAAAVLGGIVAWGANGSTAQEAAKDLAVAEATRDALIGQIKFRVVAGGETLH